MAQSLSAKVDANTADFGPKLQRAKGDWDSFGRSIDAGGARIGAALKRSATDYQQYAQRIQQAGRAFSTSGAAGFAGGASKVGTALNFAGGAAQEFAGLSGIGSIAVTLATGGPVMAALAGLAALVYASGERAREAKAHLAAYGEALKDLPRSDLETNVRALQENVQALEAMKTAAERASTAAITAAGTGKEGSLGKMLPVNRKEGTQVDAIIASLDVMRPKLEAAKAALADFDRLEEQRRKKAAEARAREKAEFLKTPEGQQQQFAEGIGRVTSALQQSANGIKFSTDLWGEYDRAISAIDARLATAGSATSEMAVKLNALKVALIGARDAARDFDLDKIAKATAGAGVASAVANAPHMPGVGAVSTTPSGVSVNMQGWVVPQPLIDLTHKTDEVKSVIEGGLRALPDALGNVLGSLLIPLFGNSRAAQVGGGLGGAFGAGAGSYLAGKAGAGIGSAIGGALLPILGTAIGGLVGGALGGLFGSGKKHMDDLAYSAGSAAVALRTFTTELLNGAAGFRVSAARYAAQTPMVMGGGGYWTEEGRGGSAGGGTPIVIQVDGRSLARVVVNTLRREAQAQWGDSLRIAEVAL